MAGGPNSRESEVIDDNDNDDNDGNSKATIMMIVITTVMMMIIMWKWKEDQTPGRSNLILFWLWCSPVLSLLDL